jgi:hypothetical protein
MTVYFQPKADVAQWRQVYERLASLKVGDVVTHEDLAEMLPDAGEGSVRSAFYRAVAECEAELHRTFGSVRGVGYRMVEAREHERLAKDHHRRARRQLKRSQRKVTSADRSQLSRDEKARLDLIELNLARQVEMTGRLEARVKTESRERKAADADLSERVDKLTALLERHGILKADAT